MGATINLAARLSKFPPSRTSNVKAIANFTPWGTNNSKVSLAYSLIHVLIFFFLQTPARVLTAERASELVRLRTQTPLFVSQAHQPAGKCSSFCQLILAFIFVTTARQTSSHVEAPSIVLQLRWPAGK